MELDPFESSVNSEGIETYRPLYHQPYEFESSVNSEGIETHMAKSIMHDGFESNVNSEGIETKKQDIVAEGEVWEQCKFVTAP